MLNEKRGMILASFYEEFAETIPLADDIEKLIDRILSAGDTGEGETEDDYADLCHVAAEIREIIFHDYPDSQGAMIGSPLDVLNCALDWMKKHIPAPRSQEGEGK